ncbi:hypothetical protein [Streptomyces sp. NPDC050659]|uniref:hypothetical protein n=1 Tax=Streptomyces sp. NPDC050659 TaxID=3157215 RepID=UPI00341DD5F4
MTIVLDQDLRSRLLRERAWLAPLVRLAEKVGRAYVFLRDPVPQHASLALVVRPLEVPECLSHGLGLRHRSAQDGRLRPCPMSGEPAAVIEVRYIDPEVVESLEQIAAEVPVGLRTQDSDDLIDGRAALSSLREQLAGVAD